MVDAGISAWPGTPRKLGSLFLSWAATNLDVTSNLFGPHLICSLCRIADGGFASAFLILSFVSFARLCVCRLSSEFRSPRCLSFPPPHAPFHPCQRAVREQFSMAADFPCLVWHVGEFWKCASESL